MSVAAQLDRDWRRFTPLQRLLASPSYLFAVVALVVSVRTIDVIPEFLYDAPAQMSICSPGCGRPIPPTSNRP